MYHVSVITRDAYPAYAVVAIAWLIAGLARLLERVVAFKSSEEL
jgi:hypothetical protein